jgi:UDP-N-acetylmuramate dehydrogenase
LREGGRPAIRYPELQKFISSITDIESIPSGSPALRTVREAVLALRRKKSMVLDPNDPNTKSVGSFFMNPVVPVSLFDEMQLRWQRSGAVDRIPMFPSGDRVKIPAAWLVEKAGFHKGYRVGNVGVSQNHSLALVNYGGTTAELLDLAARIQQTVHERFGISLEREPVMVPF